MGTVEDMTREIGSWFGFEEPEDPTPPPDPGAALSEAEEEAKRKNDERRRRIEDAGRQSTIHALGDPDEIDVDTLGA